jgi:hypothetical protein
MFTADELRFLLFYCPETGKWRWRISCGTKKAGTQAGSIDAGRVKIRIRQKNYFSARLAFFYMTGRWPIQFVDHKNRRTDDDRWCNLREATSAQNQANSKHRKKLGHKGATRPQFRRKYRARIIVGGIEHHLGMFNTPQAAHTAYMHAAKKHFGEYARAR